MFCVFLGEMVMEENQNELRLQAISTPLLFLAPRAFRGNLVLVHANN